MAKILVTGGGGFIGSRLIDKLLEQGNNVTAFDVGKELPQNLASHKDNVNFHYIGGDINDSKFLSTIVAKDTEMIYHLASMVGVKNYCMDPLKVIDVNVIGTKKLIEEAIKKNVKILFTSTSEVYGKNPAVPWKENSDRVLGDPSIDRWVYSTTKSLCEHMLNAVHRKYGLPTVIVRYFNIYGPRQAPYFIIPANIHRALNNKNLVVYDSGKQTRCFTFVDDVIEGTIKAANSPKAVGETFNIGSNREQTMSEVAKTILKASGKEGKLGIDYIDTQKLYGRRYEDLERRVPDVEKARAILGWKLTTTLEKGIEETVKWARNNPQWLRSEIPKEIG